MANSGEGYPANPGEVPLSTSAPAGQRLLLIGLGPAGLAVCRGLSKGAHITVVEPKEFVEYTPSILNGLVNPDAWRELLVSPQEALQAACGKRAKWTLLKGYVHTLRPRSAEIKPVGSDDGSCAVVEFDGAIIATGTSNGIWKADGIPLVACGAVSQTATGVTIAGREAQLRQERARLEAAAEQAREEPKLDRGQRGKVPQIVVVGGGIVGVELASEIVTTFPELRSHVTLVNRGERILSGGPACASAAASKWFAENGVNVLTGEAAKQFSAELPTDEQPQIIKYMCIGARPTLPDFEPPVQLDSKGYVLCDTQLRVLASGAGDVPWADGRVFACGDCAEIRGLEGKINKTIYPAETNAHKVAHNIEKIVLGWHWRLKSASKGLDPTVTSLGPNAAVMVVNGVTTMTGKPASLVKKAIEKSKVDETRGGIAGTTLWKLVPHI